MTITSKEKNDIEKKIAHLFMESLNLYNESQWLPESAQDRVDSRQEEISKEISYLQEKLEA